MSVMFICLFIYNLTRVIYIKSYLCHIYFVLLSLLFQFFIALAVIYGLGKNFIATQESSNKQVVAQLVKKINADTPKMMSPEVRMDPVTPLSNEIRYNYTVIDVIIEEFDAEAMKNSIKGGMINGVCSEKYMRWMMEKGIKFSYSFKDEQGTELVFITVDQTSC